MQGMQLASSMPKHQYQHGAAADSLPQRLDLNSALSIAVARGHIDVRIFNKQCISSLLQKAAFACQVICFLTQEPRYQKMKADHASIAAKFGQMQVSSDYCCN
jgi:hypothetical protein